MAEKRCATCGAPTGEQVHLCSPGSAAPKAYVCEHCGRAESDPRHVCFPKLAEMKFVCGGCGRVAVRSDALCKPKPIEGAARGDGPAGKGRGQG